MQVVVRFDLILYVGCESTTVLLGAIYLFYFFHYKNFAHQFQSSRRTFFSVVGVFIFSLQNDITFGELRFKLSNGARVISVG